MNRILLNRTQQTLEAVDVSGCIIINLDDRPSNKLTFSQKLKITFCFRDELEGLTEQPFYRILTKSDSSDSITDLQDSIALSSSFHNGLLIESNSENMKCPQDDLSSHLLSREMLSFEKDSDSKQGPHSSLTFKIADSLCHSTIMSTHLENTAGAFSQVDESSLRKTSPYTDGDFLENVCLSNTYPSDKSKTAKVVEKKTDQKSEHSIQKPDPEITCLYCKKTFSSKARMTAHNRVLRCVRQCQKCLEHFLCDADLFIHQHKRHDAAFITRLYPSFSIQKKSLCKQGQCPLCQKHFQSSSGVLKHLQSVHFLDASYMCCVCDNAFKEHSSLKSHLEQYHCSLEKQNKEVALNELVNAPKNNNTRCGITAHNTLSKLIKGQQLVRTLKTSSGLNDQDEEKKDSSMDTSVSPSLYLPHQHTPNELGEASKLGGSSTVGTNISCHLCQKSFSSLAEKAAHQRVPDCVRKCKICGGDFLCEADFFLHQYKDHPEANLKKQYPKYEILDRNLCKKLKCPLCEKILKTKKLLQLHIQAIHFSDSSYACCVCGCDFRTQSCLKSHLHKHNLEQYRKRKLSSQSKSSVGTHLNSIRGHLKVSHMNLGTSLVSNTTSKRILSISKGVSNKVRLMTGKFPCKHCGKIFSSQNERNDHKKVSPQEIKCPKCPRILSSQTSLIIHNFQRHEKQFHEEIVKDDGAESDKNADLELLEGQSLSRCPLCGKEVRSKLWSHVSLHHTKELMYQCCVCGEKSVTSQALKTHCDTHLRPPHFQKGTFRCSRCPVISKSRSEFYTHVAIHRSQCIFCNKDLGHPHLLEAHYETEHAEQVLSCDICGKIMPTEQKLADHKKNHRYPFSSQCPVCGLVLRAGIKKHIQRHHSQEQEKAGNEPVTSNGIDGETSVADNIKNQHKCLKCSKTFSSKFCLSHHLKTHNPQRLKCPTCKKTFSSQNNFTKHVDTIHLKRKIYTCEICGKRSTSRHNLKVHKLIHAPTKLFTCEVCGQGFNYKASFQGHMKSKHGKDCVK